MPNPPSLAALQMAIESNPGLAQDIKDDPKAGIQKLTEAAQAYEREKDPFIYRTVVIVLSAVLGITVLALAIALFVNTVTGAPTELIVGLGSTALGALAGLLAPSPVRNG